VILTSAPTGRYLASVTWLRLALLPVMLYVLADFASPYVPGILSFELDECVDGVRSERLHASAERPVIVPALSARALERPRHESLTQRPAARTPTRRSPISVRGPRYPTSDPAASADDH
jgi:hypothetical protein